MSNDTRNQGDAESLAMTIACLIHLAGEIRALSSSARVELAAFLARQVERGAPVATVWEALAMVVVQVEMDARGAQAESEAITSAIGDLERMLNNPMKGGAS